MSETSSASLAGEWPVALSVPGAPALVWCDGPGGSCVSASQAFLQFVAHPRAPLDPQLVGGALHPDDRQEAERLWAQTRLTGTACRGEVRLRAAQGNYHRFLVDYSPAVRAQGEPWFMAVATPVNPAPVQLPLLPGLASAPLAAVIEDLPDAVYIGDERGVTCANQAALDLLGVAHRPGQPGGAGSSAEPLGDGGSSTGQWRPPQEEAFALALAGSASVSDVLVRHPQSGEDRLIRCAAAPIRINGAVVGAVVVGSDITGSAQGLASRLSATLERRVQERTEQLQEANEELDAFSYSVSHDLRTPVRHILGFADLLRRKLKGGAQEEGQEYLDIIRGSAKRMNLLIDDLLAFSRTAREPLTTRALDLQVLVREVALELTPDIAGRQVEWQLSGLSTVHGDRALLKVVLTNLLSNALKYSRTRPVSRIEVTANAGEREDTILIRDNGVGFDPGYSERLFGVFQRLHSAEEFEGTGVGLATVRRIVHRHGGRVWAEGQPGVGATFAFTLPRSGATGRQAP